MKKVIIICGLIAGLIVSVNMLITTSIYCVKGDFDHGMIYGFASMFLAFSLIFVGIKNFRDKQNGGYISFGKAFTIGSLIALIASTMYVLTWQIDLHCFVPDFMEKFTAHTIAKVKASNLSATELAKQISEANKLAEMYKNPFFNILMTYMEILPLSIIVSAIAALILKKNAQAA